MISAIIAAAGSGERFGAPIPKALIHLGDKTLLEHAIANLASVVDEIIVTAPAGYESKIQELVGDGCFAIRTSICKMRMVCTERDLDKVYSIAKLDLLIRRNAYPHVMQTVATIPFCNVSPTLMSGPWPPFSFVDSHGTIENKNAFSKQEQRSQIRLEANA